MTKENKSLSVFVALDRSGSMSGERWTSSIASLNAYIKGLQDEKIEGDVTIVAFDAVYRAFPGESNYTLPTSNVRLTNIVENMSIAYFEPLDPAVITPEGNTPLYDAAANVMSRALERNSDRTVVVIITDGQENASVEYTQAKIKEKVAVLQEKKWEVIFLGANFDVSSYTQGSGLAFTKSRNVNFNDAAALRTMTADLISNTTAYTTGGISMDMSGVQYTNPTTKA